MYGLNKISQPPYIMKEAWDKLDGCNMVSRKLQPIWGRFVDGSLRMMEVLHGLMSILALVVIQLQRTLTCKSVEKVNMKH